MNIENIKVGDKFPTEQKLIQECGFVKARCNSKKAQIKEIQCYLAYEKTHKILRGKETNEIVITNIFEIPNEKNDNRKNNGSKLVYYPLLINLINDLHDGSYSKNQVFCERMGFDKDLLNKFSTKLEEIPQEIIDYNYHLKALLENAIKSTCNEIKRNNYEYENYKCIIMWNDNLWNERKSFVESDNNYMIYEKLQIESAKEIIEENGIKNISFINKDGEEKRPYQIEYSLTRLKIDEIWKKYRERLSKKVDKELKFNKSCRGFLFPNKNENKNKKFNMKNDNFPENQLWNEKEDFINVIEEKMDEYIDKKELSEEECVIKHHERMFEMQFTNLDEYLDVLNMKLDEKEEEEEEDYDGVIIHEPKISSISEWDIDDDPFA